MGKILSCLSCRGTKRKREEELPQEELPQEELEELAFITTDITEIKGRLPLRSVTLAPEESQPKRVKRETFLEYHILDDPPTKEFVKRSRVSRCSRWTVVMEN